MPQPTSSRSPRSSPAPHASNGASWWSTSSRARRSRAASSPRPMTRSRASARALEGIHLDAGIALDLDLGPHIQEAGRLLAAIIKQGGGAAAASNVQFGFDPIGAAAVSGASPLPRADWVACFNAAISDLAAEGFRGPFAPADGRVIHNAAGSEAQELAYVLAVAVEYLRALEAGGIALDAARRMVYFRLAADVDEFLTIAKFRALRMLW